MGLGRSAAGGLALVVLLCAGGVGAALWSPPARAQDSAALVHVDPVRLEAATQTAPVIGRLVARQAGEVAARVGGAVAEYLVEVGEPVAAGQVVARLDDSILAARHELAKARLSAARAALQTRRAERELARQTLARIERLRGSAAFTQARFEDQVQAVAVAEAQVGAAEGEIASAEAEQRIAELELYHAEVRAPYAGVVTRRMSEAGAYVSAGDPLLAMVGDRELEIEADVPYRRLGGLEPGTEVALELADGSRHKARVRAVVPEEDPLTRTRPVRLTPEFDSPVRTLAPGQSVTVEIPLGAVRQVLTVSKDAVVPRQSDSVVFVVTDGKAEQRRVELGEAIGDRFEVLTGLAEGEPTVVRGNERLRDGQPVRVEASSAGEAGAGDAGKAGNGAAG